jgi:hypothetical protein
VHGDTFDGRPASAQQRRRLAVQRPVRMV